MAIKFSVLRIGDPSDRGPQGECGILLVGTEGGKSHGETVHCPLDHQHSKTCAATALDAQSFVLKPEEPAVEEVLGEGDVVLVPAKAAVPAITESPRQRIQKWFDGLAVKVQEEATAAAKVDPLPMKTVQKVVDGKSKSVQVEDRDL